MDVVTSTMERLMLQIRYILFPVLSVLSLIYYFCYLAKRKFMSRREISFPNVKIVCVGNPTLGGSGKTVIVEKLLKGLKSKGRKVAVVIRGYKRKFKKEKVVILSSEQSISSLFVYNTGDEAFMLFDKHRVPIGISSDRVKSINQLINYFKPEIIISDDGYQNFKFHKDLNILVINLYDFKNKKLYLFPLGNLREPIPDAVKRADYVILNHSRFVPYDVFLNIVNMIKKINKNVKIISTYYRIEYFVNLLTKKQFKCNEFLLFYPNVSLACGIGKPELFVKTLEVEGFTIVHKFIYPDHYWYKTKDVKKWYKMSNYPIVVSYKDAVRLAPLVEHLESIYINKLYYCDIKVEIDQGEKLWQEMLNIL